MPTVAVPQAPKSEFMFQALKIHITRERQKKKQEQEADAEEERQRKERERQQKQDVMTLGETREQISQLEQQLAAHKDEKHQLFLQLKKVLNEDDNRRRQLVKESNDHMLMHSYPGVTLGGHPQLFLQQSLPLASRNPVYKVGHAQHPHSLLPPGALKRSRSPSPPPANYHQGYGYKGGAMPAYAQQQKVDESRRGNEYVRAVLWNKNTAAQYGSQAFYPPGQPVTTVGYASAPSGQTVYTYATQQFAQPPAGAAPVARDEPKQPVYLGQPRTSQQGYSAPHHQPLEQKPAFVVSQEEKYYPSSQIRPSTHVPIHGGAIPIQQPPQGAKTGGITSGYPIRAQLVPVSHPGSASGYPTNPAPPHSGYGSQAPGGRMLYSQPGSHQASNHQPPVHQPPSHQPPSHQAPSHQPSGHQPSGHQPPSHQPSGHQPSSHQPPSHQPSGHQPSGHQPSGHQPSGHQPPGHQPSGHQPPGHPPSGHQPPGHQPQARYTVSGMQRES